MRTAFPLQAPGQPARAPVSYPLVSTLAPLGAVPTAPGCARAHLRNTLGEWNMDGHGEVAELVASELVTNAVEASTDGQGHPVYIDGHMAIVIFRMLANRDGLVLEAWDLAPAVPVVRNAGTYDEDGRGLFLVQTLAYRWDWKVVPDWPGKCVWAEIRLLPMAAGTACRGNAAARVTRRHASSVETSVKREVHASRRWRRDNGQNQPPGSGSRYQ